MSDDAFPFEMPRVCLDALKRRAACGELTIAEAVEAAYSAGYAAGRDAETNYAARIVRVGNPPPPEAQT